MRSRTLACSIVNILVGDFEKNEIEDEIVSVRGIPGAPRGPCGPVFSFANRASMPRDVIAKLPAILAESITHCL